MAKQVRKAAAVKRSRKNSEVEVKKETRKERLERLSAPVFKGKSAVSSNERK